MDDSMILLLAGTSQTGHITCRVLTAPFEDRWQRRRRERERERQTDRQAEGHEDAHAAKQLPAL